MLHDAQLVAFLATTDLDRSREFFVEHIGLSCIEQTPYACVFDVQGTPLRVTLVNEMRAAPYTVVGWVVDDIAECVRALANHGVNLERFAGMAQDDIGVWTTPGGDRVAWFKDPDDNVLSLTQFATGAGQRE